MALPAGLTIDSNTGTIAGIPTTANTYNVTVTVSDTFNNVDINFIWVVSPPSGSCGGLAQEAELGTLSGDMVIGVDGAASGGFYVHKPEGTGNQSYGSTHNVSFCVVVPTTGDYQIKGWIHADGGGSDSFFVDIDGQPPNGYLWDTLQNTTYAEDYVSDRNGADPVVVTLSGGEHTLYFYVRDDGTRLDKFEMELISAANQPPTITNPGNQTNTVNDFVNFDVVATDPENDPLTYSAVGLPAGLLLGQDTGNISGTLTVAATSLVTITVSDGAESDSTAFSWIVTAPNQPPTITNPGNQSNTVNDFVNFDVVATDPENDPLTYSAVGLPAGLLLGQDTGNISGTLTVAATSLVTITVSDGAESDSTAFSWIVTAPNQPPTITNPGNQTNTISDFVDFDLTATDPENDPLTYSAVGLPAGLLLGQDTGNISGTLTVAATSLVTITVSDGAESDSTAFSWIVTAPNQPPTITNPGNQTNTISDFVDFDLTATDPENDPLTYSAVGLPAGLLLGQDTGNISGTLTVAATSLVTITVSDGNNSDNTSFTWDVLANQSPDLINPGNQTSTLSDTISLSLVATDPENHPLAYTATGLPTGLSINPISGVISGTSTATGLFTVSATVNDDRGGVDNEVFTWTINEPTSGCGFLTQEAENAILSGNFIVENDPNASGGQFIYAPNGTGNESFGSIHNATFCFTVTEPGIYRINGQVWSQNGGSNSFFATVDGLPATGNLWVTTIDTTYVTDYIGDRNGDDPIEVLLAAGDHTVVIYQREDGTRLDKLTLEFLGSEPPNQSPTLNSLGNQTNTINDSVSLTLTATDPENDPLTYSAVGLPAGLSINATSGEISGIVTITGTQLVTATVDDGQGNSDSISFSWLVNDPIVVSCHPSVQEAEAGLLSGSFAIVNDATASGGQYIEVPNGVGNAGFGSASNASYCFDITQPGTYRIEGQVWSPNGGSNSFYVTADDLPANGYLWATPQDTTFVADYIGDRNGADPVEVIWGTGQHTVTVYLREDGTKLDKLTLELVSAGSGNLPPSVTNPGNQANLVNDIVSLQITATDPENDPLAYSATGLPTGLSVISNTGEIAGTATTVGNYNTTVSVDDGQGNIEDVNFAWAVQTTQATTGTLETVNISNVNDSWSTVNLDNSYTSPVVVCSVVYANNTLPQIVRVRNATTTSFEVRIQNPSGSPLLAETVQCIAAERGVWALADGRKLEAQTVNSTLVAYKNNWIAESQGFGQTYTNPVVIGQVMSENDSNWSVFWSRGSSQTEPVSATDLRVGHQIGADPNQTRASEVLGYIIIEAGNGTADGVAYEAALGANTVQSYDDNNAGFTYTFTQAFAGTPAIAVVTQAAMNGGDGSWGNVVGPNPLTNTTLQVALDEEQLQDSERFHTTEQLSYWVFELDVTLTLTQ